MEPVSSITNTTEAPFRTRTSLQYSVEALGVAGAVVISMGEEATEVIIPTVAADQEAMVCNPRTRNIRMIDDTVTEGGDPMIQTRERAADLHPLPRTDMDNRIPIGVLKAEGWVVDRAPKAAHQAILAVVVAPRTV